jgi:uncharacterized protein (UPF0212 family)
LPRAFDSDEPGQDLSFTENVECPGCGEIFEGEFTDHTKSLTVQDMVEPPSGTHQCPACRKSFGSVMTGWMFYGEAG